jgi:hypothetical protein
MAAVPPALILRHIYRADKVALDHRHWPVAEAADAFRINNDVSSEH